eukprot:gene13015-biopygen6486
MSAPRPRHSCPIVAYSPRHARATFLFPQGTSPKVLPSSVWRKRSFRPLRDYKKKNMEYVGTVPGKSETSTPNFRYFSTGNRNKHAYVGGIFPRLYGFWSGWEDTRAVPDPPPMLLLTCIMDHPASMLPPHPQLGRGVATVADSDTPPLGGPFPFRTRTGRGQHDRNQRNGRGTDATGRGHSRFSLGQGP